MPNFRNIPTMVFLRGMFGGGNAKIKYFLVLSKISEELVARMRFLPPQKSRMAWWIKANWTLCPYQMFQLIENLESIKCPRPLRKPRSLDWEPPIGNMLKFNVDGASRGNPRVIVGWLGC